MVAQAEAISSAQDEQLERKKLTAQAIRRGELSISAPIETTVASTGVDPLDQPATTSNFNFDSSASAGRVADSAPHVLGEVHEADAEDTDRTAAAFAEQPPLRHKRSSVCIRDMNETNGELSTPNTFSFDPNGGSLEYPPGSPNKMELKKRRSRTGTLRSVLRKMFGRKQKSVSMAQPVTQKFGHEYHRSDPGFPPGTAVTRTKDEDDEGMSHHTHQRILSLPLQETPRKSPMRTLPFPMNVNAPQEPSPQSPHNYISFETAPQVHRRRATLPSVILSPSEIATLNAAWNQSEHLASPEPTALSPALSNSEIGLAVTSGTAQRAGIQKRRSRSVGDLPLMVKQFEQEESRRRSAEIKAWRESFLPQPESQHGSIHDDVSVYTGKETEREEQEPMDIKPSTSPQLFEQIAEMDMESESGADGRIANLTTAYDGEGTPDEFFSPSSKHQQRPESSEPPQTVDARLTKLEDNVHLLEQSFQKLSGRNNRHTIIIGESPARPRTPSSTESCHARERDRSHDRNDSATAISSSTTHQHSSRDRAQSSSTHSSPQTQDGRAGSKASRGHLSPTRSQPSLRPPTAATTIATGASSVMSTTPDLHMPPRQPSPSTIDHLAPLYNALRYERTVRKQLEQQVLSLQRGVLELQATVHELRTGQTLVGSASAGAWRKGYPTPSPEFTFNQSRFSGLGEEDEDGDDGWRPMDDEKERDKERTKKVEKTDKRRGRRKASEEEFATPTEEVMGQMF